MYLLAKAAVSWATSNSDRGEIREAQRLPLDGQNTMLFFEITVIMWDTGGWKKFSYAQIPDKSKNPTVYLPERASST